MKRFTFILLASAVFFFFCALSFSGCTDTAPPVDPPAVEDVEVFPEPGNPKCPPGCCPTGLAGRYHQRGRTNRFFGRVS